MQVPVLKFKEINPVLKVKTAATDDLKALPGPKDMPIRIQLWLKISCG